VVSVFALCGVCLVFVLCGCGGCVYVSMRVC